MKKYFVLLIFIILAITIYQKESVTNSIKTIFTKGKETIQSVINKIEPAVNKRLERSLTKVGFSTYPEKIILVALKEERLLQVFGKIDNQFKLIKSYPFTAFSGQLGPKLKEGDRQIPEGIYKIEYLNPNSSYHLSLKVNYPNKFDQSKTTFLDKKKMGSDIFIHGKAVTVGCIPIGDLAVEEVFVLVQKAMNKEVIVIIAPRDFRRDKRYPVIEGIDWEKELYRRIEAELIKLLEIRG